MRVLKYFTIGMVRFYQVAISPLFPSSCRHQPTCSQYMIDAINEWGVVRGLILGTNRLLRCHPWGTKGYDPVPQKKTYSNDVEK
ncbi:MAG: membrane protein insertion efficiency factor YidD [Bacteroidota bacterium]